MTEAMKYFSTKYTVVMMGVRYIPAVCYKLDETIAPTIEKLVEAGEAKMYPEKVRFVNGAPIAVKEPEQQALVKSKGDLIVTGSGKRSIRDFE